LAIEVVKLLVKLLMKLYQTDPIYLKYIPAHTAATSNLVGMLGTKFGTTIVVRDHYIYKEGV
jgi:hypothetical protein